MRVSTWLKLMGATAVLMLALTVRPHAQADGMEDCYDPQGYCTNEGCSMAYPDRGFVIWTCTDGYGDEWPEAVGGGCCAYT